MFTRPELNAIAAESIAALKAVAERHGCTVADFGGKFDTYTFTPKITFTKTTTASGESVERVAFRDMAHLMNLNPDAYGKSFSYGGRTYTIYGIKPSLSKPILCRRDDGKLFKFQRNVTAMQTLTSVA